MPAFGLSFIIQVALIVHVLRTDRPYYWIMIIFIPGIGPLVYFIVELLPGFLGTRQARGAVRGVMKTLNPGAGLRQRQRELQLSGSVDAARHLAEELMELGQDAKAIEHYKKALSGLYKNDPDLLLGLATAQFGTEEYEQARQTLDRLIEKNPGFKSSAGHLLYARSMDASGDYDKAREEYAAVVVYYAGAEARLRYGVFLEARGDNDAAIAEFEEILATADLAPRHYRRAQRMWITEAKAGIRRLSG
jgi:hypothetical protein